MKNYKCLFLAATFLSGLLSCKKSFLDDVSNRQSLFRQDYVLDLKTTNEYLNGIYTNVGSYLFHGYHTISPDLMADNLKPVIGSSGITPLLSHYNWSQTANEASPVGNISPLDLNSNGISYGAYQVIRAASFVLEKTEEFKSQDPGTAASMKGQALAFRAMAHFTLVNFFAQSYNFTADGSHPGIAYVTSSNWTDAVKGRNTVAEVYSGMIADLNEAILLLPASTSTVYMNRNAARALLARVYLYKGDWTMAKNLARQVGTAVPIMMANYPAKLFTPAETEALFQLPPARSGGTSIYSHTTNFAGQYFNPAIQFQATTDIATLLNEDPADLRKVWVNKVGANWNVTKFPQGVVADVTPAPQSYYHTVIRSSEMYLTAAEAYAQLNNVDSARFYLDAIRKRANPAVAATNTTGTALLEAIYKERRKELAFEGTRMFDLLRWKKGVNRTDALSGNVQVLSYPSSKAIAPIPVLDVKVSGLAQNADY